MIKQTTHGSLPCSRNSYYTSLYLSCLFRSTAKHTIKLLSLQKASIMRVDSWDSLAAQKRRECAAKIPEHWKVPVSVLQNLDKPLEENLNNLLELDIVRQCGIMTERELRITESFPVKDLLEALASGQLTSLEVTIAYSKRAAIAQQLVSLLINT